MANEYTLPDDAITAISMARAELADAQRLCERCRNAGIDAREREMFTAALKAKLDKLEAEFGAKNRG